MVLGAHRVGPSNRLSIEIKGLEAGQLSPLDSRRNSSEITYSFHKSCVGEGGGGGQKSHKNRMWKRAFYTTLHRNFFFGQSLNAKNSCLILFTLYIKYVRKKECPFVFIISNLRIDKDASL